MKKLLILALAVTAALPLLTACGNAKPVSRPAMIIPQPAQMTVGDDSFKLKSGMTIAADSALAEQAAYLIEVLRQDAGLELEQGSIKRASVRLALGTDGDPRQASPESYVLKVDKDGITITGATPRGVVMGIATLRQLVPVDRRDSRIPFVEIHDSPRYGWRGMHLDVSRHFYTVEQVKGFIDRMALYKFNKFHWHLTDDQGWRIDIKQYPLLTAEGAWRKFDRNDRECMRQAREQNNPDLLIPEELLRITEQGDTLYGGFYTQEQIRDVVAYAAARGIDVLPEIDMPGHLKAALDNYPWASCTGKPGWGAEFSSPLCVGRDSAVMFAKNIYSEVFDLFPFEYVHIGGDEVEKTNWINCPACQERIRAKGLGGEKELHAWFIHEMEAHFNANERKLIGWDEIVDGGLSPTATVMWWRDWAPRTAVQALDSGNRVILAPDFLLYFDFIEKGDDLQRVYTMDPPHYHKAWSLSPEAESRIWGVQANTWCERIPSMARVEWQTTPRMIALSETAWSTPDNRSWDNFLKKLAHHAAWLDAHGVNYRIPDLTGFGERSVFLDTATVRAESFLPHVQIRYTTDGSEPTLQSALWSGDTLIRSSTTFVFRGFRPDGRGGIPQRSEYKQEPALPALDVSPEKAGIRRTQYEFRGRRCADIEMAREADQKTVDAITFPDDIKGWVGLIFEGYFNAPETGIYTFALTSNDGSKLYIDGTETIDNDGPHGDVTRTGQRSLAKGWHRVRVEFFDMNNGGTLGLQWALPSSPGTLRTFDGLRY